LTVIKKHDGTAWQETIVGRAGQWDGAQTIRAETASTTLTSVDAGRVVAMNSSSATVITVNSSTSFVPGQRVDFLRQGTGDVVIGGTGVTIHATPGLKLRARYSGASLLCVRPNVYVLAGDLDETPQVSVTGAIDDYIFASGSDVYRVARWTTSGTIAPTTPIAVEYLVVAGGGGGGGSQNAPNFRSGGGGGAGGLLTGQTVAPIGTSPVVIGAGGAGASEGQGATAGNSSVLGITALGGGGGGGVNTNGSSGGSGGGAGARFTSGGAGTASQGNSGGSSDTNAGGGGGGAGGVGQNGAGGTGALGGAGSSSSIAGSSLVYAAGGRGGASSGSVSGVDGLGQGGSGSWNNALAGSGGNGVVIARWKL
jgi:hypothetical protein